MLPAADFAFCYTYHMEKIILGGGCFWCLEAVFVELKGVEEVRSGYAGGETGNPSYEEVCRGNTGHAEVVEVTYDPTVLALHDLLVIFFTLHDPTTLNQQGADIGTQYRSIILYITPQQREIALSVMEEITDEAIWPDPLVTELQPLDVFYVAEDYHQQYFAKHPEQGYCRIIIAPKVSKLRQKFQEKLRS
jgi:peptide-methionine (S)-S-oxide reductase